MAFMVCPSKEIAQIMEALGLPTNVHEFHLHFVMNEVVRVTAEIMVRDMKTDDLVATLKRYRLVEIDDETREVEAKEVERLRTDVEALLGVRDRTMPVKVDGRWLPCDE